MVYRLSRLFSRLQSLILPPACIACGDPGQLPHLDLCAGCEAELPINHPACGRCGVRLAGDAGAWVCGLCLRRPPYFDSAHCAYGYEFPIDNFVRTLKYGQTLAHAQVLGILLARQLKQRGEERWPECFVPVPLSLERFRSRGYNQAIEIGRYVERSLGVSMRTDAVARVRHTAEQAGLPRRTRRSNVRGAFALLHAKVPAHVAILDDVVTTGSTVNELARLLRRAGAQRIEVWACARASRDPANAA